MKNKPNEKRFNNLYLAILIILLILSIVISFKTGEEMYYLLNTNLSDKVEESNTEIAVWGFSVRIEY